MHASRLVPALLLVLVLPAVAVAGKLYQWKDARGVSHYSDSPPPASAYKSRYIDSTAPAASATPAAATTPAAKPKLSPCEQARANLAALQGSAPVGLDANRDGVPDSTLDAAGRAAQVQQAQATMNRFCTSPATASIGQ